jgi:hypothetical protein
MNTVIVLGAACAGLFATALGLGSWAESLPRFLGIYGMVFLLYVTASVRAGRSGEAGDRFLLLIWLTALGMRCLTLATPLSLSDDLYRYLWDGRVLAHGINPYRYAPTAPELVALRDAVVWPAINNPTLPTIYPPLLQFVFAGVATVAPTVLGMRVAMTLFDLAAGFFLMRGLAAAGRSRAMVLVYLWNPLVVIEFSGSGHADAVGLFLLAVALDGWVRRRHMVSGAGLALAGLVKFLPWCAAPLLMPKLKWRWLLLPALVAAAYLPFRLGGVDVLGSLEVFASKWRSNDFVFGWLFRESTDPEASLLVAKRWSAGIVAAVWLVAVALRRPWPSVFSWTVGVALLVSPVAHPWYVTWLVPALVFLPHVAWLAWTGLAVLAYLPLPGFLADGAWQESHSAKLVQYIPVLVLLGVQALLEARASRARRELSGSPSRMIPT